MTVPLPFMPEILPLVDKRNKVVGKVDRKLAHQKKLRHRGVHILVFNRKGELFVQQRTKTKDAFPLYWDASVGGHQDYGETALHAAKRELREELGIRAKKLRRIGMFTVKAGPEREIIRAYVLKNYGGKIKRQRAEVKSGRFVPVEVVRKQLRTKRYTPPSLKALRLVGVKRS